MVAYEWGYKNPEDFWRLPHPTQALMIQFLAVRSEMQAYEDKVNAPKTPS